MCKEINAADVHTYSHVESKGIQIQRICKSVTPGAQKFK